jgi:hypothetical protein
MMLVGGGTIYDTAGLRYHWYGRFLLKYDPQGSLLWQWFSDTTRDGSGCWHCCQTDTAGNIIVAGPKVLPDSSAAVELRRFTPNGDTSWTFYCPLRGRPSTTCGLGCLAVDRQGDIIAAGQNNDTADIYKVTQSGGVEEAGHGRPVTGALLPTIIGTASVDMLVLATEAGADLYDAGGRLLRKVETRRALPPLTEGVYFLRGESPSCRSTGKLVVVR